MHPSQTAANYDALAHYWQQNVPADYGVAQLKKALQFTKTRGPSLDIGCGSQGRFINILAEHGFQAEGLDVSPEMIALAQQQSPHATFHRGDISQWQLPKKYSFISAWDSTFHLPIDQQEPVLRKLIDGLEPQGILIFTCGGGPASEITGSFGGQTFDYSTLGIEEFVRLIGQADCFCRHVEYDQYPEQHVYIIAQKA